MEDIKKDFVNVLLLRKNIIHVFEKIATDMDTLKQIYKDMIQSNAEKNASSIFGIDAFLFQHKLIEIEYDNIVTVYKTIDNRIYYEHNKLFKMVKEYVDKEFVNTSVATIEELNKRFPAYKHLDITKEYDISNTIEIQSIIVKTIVDMSAYLEKKEIELRENKKQIKKGLNIDNLINTQTYRNAIIKTNIDMFIQYLQTFNRHHTHYLNELFIRSKNVLGNIHKNISICEDNEVFQMENEVSQMENEICENENEVFQKGKTKCAK